MQLRADVDAPTLAGWYARYADWLTAADIDQTTARAADGEHLPGQPQTAEAFFGAASSHALEQRHAVRAR